MLVAAASYVNRFELTIDVLSTVRRCKEDVFFFQLWDTRLNAACHELGTNFLTMRRTLNEVGIGLDRKSLQHLAIWEPRTFRVLQVYFSLFFQSICVWFLILVFLPKLVAKIAFIFRL